MTWCDLQEAKEEIKADKHNKEYEEEEEEEDDK